MWFWVVDVWSWLQVCIFCWSFGLVFGLFVILVREYHGVIIREVGGVAVLLSTCIYLYVLYVGIFRSGENFRGL